MACMTCQRSSDVWLRLLSYLAWPFMKSRKYGRGQMSCDKLTTHWGLYWKALNSSEQYPHQSPWRLWDWWAYTTQLPLPLQWHDPLPLVWEGGPEWGDRHQPPLDSALQASPGMQQILQLPINLIRHPPQVSLIWITVSRRHAEWISPNWDSEQRSQGELGFPQAALLGTPLPIGTDLEENQMEKVLPANLQHPITCFPTHLDQVATH